MSALLQRLQDLRPSQENSKSFQGIHVGHLLGIHNAAYVRLAKESKKRRLSRSGKCCGWGRSSASPRSWCLKAATLAWNSSPELMGSAMAVSDSRSGFANVPSSRPVDS